MLMNQVSIGDSTSSEQLIEHIVQFSADNLMIHSPASEGLKLVGSPILKIQLLCMLLSFSNILYAALPCHWSQK